MPVAIGKENPIEKHIVISLIIPTIIAQLIAYPTTKARTATRILLTLQRLQSLAHSPLTVGQ
jgi:hypothetical protein